MGWADDSMFVTVNVSGVQLREAGFVDGTRRALRLSGLPADRLVLDINESTLIDDRDDTSEQLQQLRDDGIRTALDDYGTGRSSLASVQRLPLDIIKIDREIVQSIDEVRSNALANTIINMARNLGLRTVAEGVETESQALELARLGCEFAQGYLFFKPLSAVAMTALAEFERQPMQIGFGGWRAGIHDDGRIFISGICFPPRLRGRHRVDDSSPESRLCRHPARRCRHRESAQRGRSRNLRW